MNDPHAHTTRSARKRKPLDDELESALRRVFGFPNLRPGQDEVIRSVLDGHDTLAVMPTGAGKSLCYQLPALQFDGMTVIVSPLISLMRDQASKLAEAGIAAAVLNSTLTASEAHEVMEAVAGHALRMLFVTPERLANADFTAELAAPGMPAIALVVIDEAHCISQWGHDFRPAYVELVHAIHALGRPPVLALTATATPAVMEDIVRELSMRHARVIHTGVYRDNLHFSVEQLTNPQDKRQRAIDCVREAQGSGIVYCATIAECEALHAALVEAGVEAGRYHGKLSSNERSESQDAFMEDRVRVMVATNAFGMGIDKPDIRFVIHAQMPGSLDAYYQEAGRAGRDGKPARCMLLFEMKDRHVQQFFMSGRYPSRETIARVALKVREFAQEGGSGTLEKPLARLREALPDIGANKLRVATALLGDIGMTRRTRRGGLELRDDHFDESRLDAAAKEYAARSARDRAVLERMIGYAQGAQCRWRTLLDYFAEDIEATRTAAPRQASEIRYRKPEDELGGERCGTCDNCLQPPQVSESPREQREQERAEQSESTCPEAARFKEGDRVRVRRYGEGVVEMISGERVAVRFADDAVRTFIGEYVKRARKAS